MKFPVQPSEVRGVGVGVPGPVAFSRGEPVAPPIMPGWDGFSVPNWFGKHYEAPVLVDNDVNIMALGEHWTHWRDIEHLLYVKIGTGIGCGIVAGRRIHRGAQGAAGDIGHVRLAGHDEVVCRCGNIGCLEAVAGGRALASNLTALGLTADSSRDVVGAGPRRRAAGDPGRPRRGPLPRRGPGRLRELLQPGRDRDRRRHLRSPPAVAGRRARGDLPAVAAVWPRAICGSCLRGWATGQARSARRSW